MTTTPFPLIRAAAALTAAAVLTVSCSSGDAADPPEVGSAGVVSDSTATADSSIDSDDAASAADPVQEGTAMPAGLLAPDSATYFGLTWFSPPEPAARSAIEAHWQEASAASGVGRVMVDWVDVEPERGVYRFDELADSLAELTASGVSPMVSIVALDLSGTDFPAWLGEFEPEAAADAYLAMLDAAMPTLREHGVWLLAIANEPPLSDFDESELADFAGFVDGVTRSMDELAPDLPVTFTFAGGDPFIPDPAIDRMLASVDALSVNHYCLGADLVVRPLTDAVGEIDRIVQRAGELPIVFQEFGCPAGAANGSSDADQLAWFEVAFDHIESIEQIRAAFVFEFLDWSDATFDLDYGGVVELLEAELGAEFVDRFRGWLLSSGLVRNDGTTRPAFDLFLETARS